MTTKPRKPRPIGPAAAADAIAARIAEMPGNEYAAAMQFRADETAAVQALIDKKLALVPEQDRAKARELVMFLNHDDLPEGLTLGEDPADAVEVGAPADPEAPETSESDSAPTPPLPRGVQPLSERAANLARLAGRTR